MEKYILKNGKEINFEINYRNLFSFQMKYSNSKDLIEAVTKKHAFDHETVMQMLYVGYLGGKNDDTPMSYEEFLDNSTFDFKRDLTIFNNIVNNQNNEKN